MGISLGGAGGVATSSPELRESEDLIAKKIEDIQEYKISPEAQRRLDILMESKEKLVSGAEEATGIAEMRAGMVEAPGSAQSTRDIEESSRRQIQAIREMGGVGALGAAAQVGLGEEKAYEDLIKSNFAYKEQTESDLIKALQTEAGIKVQGAGLEAQALEGMIAEKDKVYQSKLSKAQTGIQFDISKIAAETQRKASAASSTRGILGIF